MTPVEEQLKETLTRVAGQVPEARRLGDKAVTQVHRRRKFTAIWSGALAAGLAAAVVVVIAVLAQTSTPTPLPGPEPLARLDVPAGSRLVGLNHVAVAVPREWGTNQTRCGVPQEDTVVIDQDAVELCMVPRPPRVDSISLTAGQPPELFGQHVDDGSVLHFDISGVPAVGTPTVCDDPQSLGPASGCSAIVYVPSEDVTVRIESTTDADVVNHFVQQIYVVPDRVAVPGYLSADNRAQSRAQHVYVQQLRDAGLAPRLRYAPARGWHQGFVTGVEPGVGTMLSPGATVT